MSSDAVKNKVDKWLEQEGYSLEMRVARAFREKGFDVIQADYYADPETGKQRELDVWAFRKAPQLCISVCAECKSSKHPWVIFAGSEELPTSGRWRTYFSTAVAKTFIGLISSRQDWTKLAASQVPARLGYSVKPALKGIDNAYDALFKACKACADKVGGSMTNVHIGIPAIVIDAELFLAYLDKDGEPRTERVESGAILWRQQVGKQNPVLVHVMNRDGIAQFTDDVREASEFLIEKCPQQLEQAFARMRKVLKRKRVESVGDPSIRTKY